MDQRGICANKPSVIRAYSENLMNNFQTALVVMLILAVISISCLSSHTEIAYAFGVFTGLLAGTVAAYMVMILCYRSMAFFVSLLSSIALCLYSALMISMGVINPLLNKVDMSLYGMMLYLIIGFGCFIASALIIHNAFVKYTEQSQVRE